MLPVHPPSMVMTLPHHPSMAVAKAKTLNPDHDRSQYFSVMFSIVVLVTSISITVLN